MSAVCRAAAGSNSLKSSNKSPSTFRQHRRPRAGVSTRKVQNYKVSELAAKCWKKNFKAKVQKYQFSTGPFCTKRPLRSETRKENASCKYLWVHRQTVVCLIKDFSWFHIKRGSSSLQIHQIHIRRPGDALISAPPAAFTRNYRKVLTAVPVTTNDAVSLLQQNKVLFIF